MPYALIAIWGMWWAGWLAVGFRASRNQWREPFVNRLPHLLLLLAGVSLYFGDAIAAQPGWEWEFPFRVMAACGITGGLGFACWARIHLGRNWSGLVAIKEGHELVSSGPYSVVRHPIYTGLIIAALMTALAVNSYLALGGCALIVAAFAVKASHEEVKLKEQFGAAYVRLCERVPDGIIPGLL